MGNGAPVTVFFRGLLSMMRRIDQCQHHNQKINCGDRSNCPVLRRGIASVAALFLFLTVKTA